VLRIPEVQRHLAWRQRVMFVEAALVLMRNGLSLRQSARALGLSQGWLHSMLKTFQKHGPHALRPKAHKFKSDTSCQFTILLDES